MSGPYGLLATGFNPKPLTDIVSELEDKYKTAFGTSVGSNPDGTIPAQKAMGQQIGILAEREALLWELGQAVNSSTDPDKAEDAALDAVCALTGTIRNGERASSGFVTATGDPGTLLPVGRVVSVLGANTRFDSTAVGTLVVVDAWATTTAYNVGDRVTSGTSPARVYQCVGAGTSATAPTGTGASIVDGTVTWRYLGEGTAAIDLPMLAEVPGPFAALSGSLTEIETPIGGWKSAINVLDAIVGAYVETNAALRIRRENELQGNAKGALNAIRATVLRVGQGSPNPVTACIVFENTTMLTDADGLPPKSVEALVLGGVDQDIYNALLDSVDGGIETYGNTTGTATDSAGNTLTIKFSRPTEVLIWIEIDVRKYPAQFPLDGMAQIIAAILDKMTKWSFGRDVTGSQISAPVMPNPANPALGVQGVLDVLVVRLGVTPGPTGSGPVTIVTREIARFDSSRILVTLSDGTP